jgi:cyclopropane-fatty-acyl-phospholipid synthase
VTGPAQRAQATAPEVGEAPLSGSPGAGGSPGEAGTVGAEAVDGTGGASRQAIQAHYDVSRDFYRLWLDDQMVYSCALWPEGAGAPAGGLGPLGGFDDDLEGAQRAKLAWHASSAQADGAARVLDIGCGWGAMMRYLRDERRVGAVTGLTLSADQADAIGASAGLEVRLEDWRDHSPSAPYDAIISIGAFEHFARQDLTTPQRRAIYRSFFERCAAWLPPGGRLSLQTIAYEDFDSENHAVSAFFTDEIFPESSLPHLADIVEAAEPSFRVIALRNDGAQYEATLHLWQQRLEASRSEALGLVGRVVYRRYLRYLRVSRAMFDRHVCTLYRFTLQRRPPTPAPASAPTEIR